MRIKTMRKPHCSGPINGLDALFSLAGCAGALIASDYLINKNFSSDTRDMGHEISGLIGLGVLAAYFSIRVCRHQCYLKSEQKMIDDIINCGQTTDNKERYDILESLQKLRVDAGSLESLTIQQQAVLYFYMKELRSLTTVTHDNGKIRVQLDSGLNNHQFDAVDLLLKWKRLRYLIGSNLQERYTNEAILEHLRRKNTETVEAPTTPLIGHNNI
jgi:hypothetical protein